MIHAQKFHNISVEKDLELADTPMLIRDRNAGTLSSVKTIVGYLPQPLSTGVIAIGVYTLLPSDGAPLATAQTGIKLPAGSVLRAIRYVGVPSAHSGTSTAYVSSSGTFDIGFGALNTDAAPMVPEMITAGTTVLATTAVASQIVGASRELTGAITQIATGTAIAFAVGATAASNFLNVAVLTTAIASGNLRVEVDYTDAVDTTV